MLPESTRRQIGQHFILGFHPSLDNPSTPPESITTLIQQYFVGSIILMKRNIPPSKDPLDSAKGVRKLIWRLQMLAKEAGYEKSLLIGTDQENGLVSAMGGFGALTQFPGAMTLAAADQDNATYEAYAATARQLKMLGINWAFAPVADVNSDSRNPVIGVRSFSDDPDKASQHVFNASKGLTDFGVASSPKHFPGHGDTSIDSHLSLPTISKSLSELQSCELKPFLHVLNSASSIMTAHIALPALTSGSSEPASLSYAVTTELLREKMRYEGVVVTDCLEMHAVECPEGISLQNPGLRALQAGADIAMICHTFQKHIDALESVYHAVESDDTFLPKLELSERRINAMKDKFAGTWDDVLSDTGELDISRWTAVKEKDESLSRSIYAKSITILNDSAHYLPLPSSSKLLVFTPQIESLNKAIDDAEGVSRDDDQKAKDEETLIDPISGAVRNTAGASYLAFVSSLRKHTGNVVHRVYPNVNAAYVQGEEDTIIVTLRNAHLAKWQLDFLSAVLDSGKKVIVLSSCAPYDLVGFRHTIAYTHLVSYEYTAPALEAAAAALFTGKAEGKLPVRLH